MYGVWHCGQEGTMKIDNSPARGMGDLLPADVAVRDHLLEAFSSVYRRFGYQRIETPALENIDRLQSGEGGDNEKLIFQVLKRGLPPEVPAGTSLRELVDLGLRYDLTVPLTRFYGNNHASLPLPFRSLQVGPVWRAERPQKGRYRQFYQCDIDIIGEPTILAEAELIEATTPALSAGGLTQAGIPGATATAALDMIAAVQNLPAGKLADALADAVPGLPDDVSADLAATAACLESLTATRPLPPPLPREPDRHPAPQLGVRPDAGARHGLLHRSGLRDHHPGLRQLGG